MLALQEEGLMETVEGRPRAETVDLCVIPWEFWFADAVL